MKKALLVVIISLTLSIISSGLFSQVYAWKIPFDNINDVINSAKQEGEDAAVNEQPVSVEPEEFEGKTTGYLGNWIRQATYINGALEHQTPSNMTLSKNSFSSSTSVCSASGSLEVKGNKMKMVMSQSDCPGVSTPLTVDYTFSVSKDDQTMIFVAGTVKEIYKRAE